MNVEDIKRLRQLTGAGIADCKEALSLSKGDMNKAKENFKLAAADPTYKKTADYELGLLK